MRKRRDHHESRDHKERRHDRRAEDNPSGGATDPLGLSEDDRRRAKKLFLREDVDGSGELDFDEFSKVMETLCPGLDQRNLEAAFRAVDVDRSGSVDYDEFIQGQQKLKQWRQKRKPKHTAARRAEAAAAAGHHGAPAAVEAPPVAHSRSRSRHRGDA